MNEATLLLGGPILMAVGAWTVTHPNGGYRAAGGAGSGLSAGTRRAAGFVLVAMGVTLLILGVASVATAA